MGATRKVTEMHETERYISVAAPEVEITPEGAMDLLTQVRYTSISTEKRLQKSKNLITPVKCL